ncbi:protein usf [Sorangium cellulosum]|uniref:Protein usf n=1 Tax=Sorangium cellulosum TaxID=56 RepID=A0A2L0EHC1_SORCE|nr:dienelactone hydrolase family protein [Sorangium cellulosum]AUX38692.1 protein usf [Sorangium cellulosum]
MSEKVSFPAKNGSSATGEIVWPKQDGKAPAVVLIQEWWGLNDQIRSLLDRLGAAGFVALAPDLYHGKLTKDPTEANRLMTELDKPRALDEIAGAVSFLAGHERTNGKVGVMGFCMGGALSFAAAATIPELAAVVPYYGVPSPAPDYSRVKAPILAHFAAHDGWATPAAAEAIRKELAARNQPMELHVYDADHAFANDTRPDVYNPDAAKIAWERSIEFLKQHLG